MAAPFDPAKAELANEFLQQGLTYDSALTQAGIAQDDFSQYQLDTLPESGTFGKVIQTGSDQPIAGETTDSLPVIVNNEVGSEISRLSSEVVATDPNLIVVPEIQRTETTSPIPLNDARIYGSSYTGGIVLPTIVNTELSDAEFLQVYPGPDPEPLGALTTETTAIEQNAQQILLDPGEESRQQAVEQAVLQDGVALPDVTDTQLTNAEVEMFYGDTPLVAEADRANTAENQLDPYRRVTVADPRPDQVDLEQNDPYESTRAIQTPTVEAQRTTSPAANDVDPLAQIQVPPGEEVRAPANTTVDTNIDPTLLLLGAAAIGPSVIPLSVLDGAALAGTNNARSQQVINTQRRATNGRDWRVKLKLGPNANYLYNAAQPGDLLFPLRSNGGTDGIIFPYTPNVQTTYSTTYQKVPLTHSNYQGLFYKNSSIPNVQITGTFTAQDTQEADYLLAVIHFLRSAGKMFYGQDAQNGAPPPVLFLSGYGEFQFNNHPLVLESFTYNLPNKVDYIRARSSNDVNLNLLSRQNRGGSAYNGLSGVITRLNTLVEVTQRVLKVKPGANPNNIPTAQSTFELGGNNPTYVPTEMEIQLTLIPIQTREQVSKQFSLTSFAQGNLLRGGFW